MQLAGQFCNRRVMQYQSECRKQDANLVSILLPPRHFNQQSPCFRLVVCNHHANLFLLWMYLHLTYVRPLKHRMPGLLLVGANQGIQRSQNEEIHREYT